MASSNKREGSNGIDFGADFSELHERPILKDADLELPTPIEVATPVEEPQPVGHAEGRGPEGAAELDPDPLTRLVTAAEKERGLPYTFRIPISMDREFRALAKEFDLDLSDIARSGLEMALLKLRQMSRAKKRPRLQ
ncbi:MAG TPA: hypothetical protein VEV41_26030 [Terriglobales bacterium]|jgi:hypothetical protein|nr:hypothetical protein [Terriglobales bacterium]